MRLKVGTTLRATRSMRCAHQACSLGPSGDDREREKMSGNFQGRTLSRAMRS